MSGRGQNGTRRHDDTLDHDDRNISISTSRLCARPDVGADTARIASCDRISSLLAIVGTCDRRDECAAPTLRQHADSTTVLRRSAALIGSTLTPTVVVVDQHQVDTTSVCRSQTDTDAP